MNSVRRRRGRRDGPRTYDNTLRAEQAAATRSRILDAALELLSEGEVAFSVPAVAARAGTSVPTVYRAFATREALLEAAERKLATALGFPEPPRELDRFGAFVPELHAAFARNHAALRAATRTANLREVVAEGRRARDRHFADYLAAPMAHLPERDRLARLGLLRALVGVDVFLLLVDRYALDHEETGRAVRWAVETLTEALRQESASAEAGATPRRRLSRTDKRGSSDEEGAPTAGTGKLVTRRRPL